jgi:pyridoxine kinase
MAILSIQSQTVTGHVGNSAAVFALQRLGHEVWALPTVLLSHHPGHGGARGGALPGAILPDLVAGVASRGCFGRCEAVLSGYLGRGENAAVVSEAVTRAKAGTPGAVYLCDPVLGDDSRLYVDAGIVGAMHNLAAKADIITPNAFELGLLSGDEIESRGSALLAMRALQAKGPKIVVLTSFAGTDTAVGTLDMMAADGAAAWRLSVPELGQKFHGAGDLFAAVFLARWLACRDTGVALGAAGSAVHGVLANTFARQADELLLIASQNLLEAPFRVFAPERIY